MERTASAAYWSVGIPWAVAAVGSVLVIVGAATGAFAGADGPQEGPYGMLGIALGVAVLTALGVQLATRRPEGFVARTSRAVAGSAAIAAVAALALIPFSIG